MVDSVQRIAYLSVCEKHDMLDPQVRYTSRIVQVDFEKQDKAVLFSKENVIYRSNDVITKSHLWNHTSAIQGKYWVITELQQEEDKEELLIHIHKTDEEGILYYKTL